MNGRPPAAAFTGKHMLTLMIAGFGVVIAVNFLMARYAVTTFGGEVVENSYVASQDFNGWLRKAAESRALGWKVDAQRAAEGRIAVTVAGAPADAAVKAVARHPVGRLPDTPLAFHRVADGQYLSTAPLPDGRWMLRVEVDAGSKDWRGERPVT